MKQKVKIIISGGGTGGHIFPAIAIANALKKIDNSIEILFVGAEGKMEMEKVPAAGYKIIGLTIRGFARKFSFENLTVIYLLVHSIFKARKIVKSFQPDVVVGVGGYASAAVLYVASRKNIPYLIQEQNFFPGFTNKVLSKKASKICVAHEGMEKYFAKEKMLLLGNPVRQDITQINVSKSEAKKYFNIQNNNKTLLILGGSLGAKTINQSIIENIENYGNSSINLIWQTGKLYFNEIELLLEKYNFKNIKVHDFISRMDCAFVAADLVVSRSGASTISELCLIGKPVIFIPSPNVAEDHQTKNALSLVSKKAARFIADKKAKTNLEEMIFDLINNDAELQSLSLNISKLALKDSDRKIAVEVLKLVENYEFESSKY